MASNSKYLMGKKSYFGAQTDNKYETFAKGIDAAINSAASSYENKGGLFPGGLAFEETISTTTTTTTSTTSTTTTEVPTTTTSTTSTTTTEVPTTTTSTTTTTTTELVDLMVTEANDPIITEDNNNIIT